MAYIDLKYKRDENKICDNPHKGWYFTTTVCLITVESSKRTIFLKIFRLWTIFICALLGLILSRKKESLIGI